MSHFAFILGREDKLSLAEILRVFSAFEIKADLVDRSSDLAVFASERDLAELFPLLGGSIKVAAVREITASDLDKHMQKLVKPAGKEKFYFGASVYKADDKVSGKQLGLFQEDVRKRLFGIRASLKEQGASVRVVESKEEQLSSVVVKKNKLLTGQGVELLLGLASEHIWIGKTLGVQDFQAFSDRDFARPFRDDRSGMLPPKLARMMINLSGKPISKQTVLLDPFCGSGTVLQEAVLLGAGKVLGSDLSDKAIDDTRRNLDWLRGERGHEFQSTIEQVDVMEVDEWLPEAFVDLIVTEPYLGTPIRKKLQPGEVNERQDALSDLYDKALLAMHRVLKNDGVLVMIFPFIGTKRVPIPRSMKRQWEVVSLPKDVSSSERGGVDYKRANQHVGREILVLRKK